MTLKKSNYSFFMKEKNSYLVYNSFSGTVIRFTDPTYIKKLTDIIESDNIEYDETDEVTSLLYKKNILVEAKTDELLMVRDLYNQGLVKSKTLEIMLVVTKQCNFRCTYCGQPHEDKRIIDSDYPRIITLIENLITENKYESLMLTFFGGEPLIEYKNIVYCLSELHARLPQIKIYAGMSTNGYLLTPERFEKLASLNCLFYQISVDGMSYTHDTTRPLINGGGTWDRIINNLKYIKSTNYDFSIFLRTNYNIDVANSLNEFYKYCNVNLSDSRIKIYYETIKDQGNELTPEIVTEAEGIVLNSEIARIINDHNLSCANYSNRISPLGHVCYAAKPNFFIIDCDLKIKKCSHQLDYDDNTIGYINNDNQLILNHAAHAKWIYNDYLNHEKCLSCKLLPLCLAKKCPNKILQEGTLYCNSELEELSFRKALLAYYATSN